jgi:hypothetical protein
VPGRPRHSLRERPQLDPLSWGRFFGHSQVNANSMGSADCEATIGIVPNCGTLPYLNFDPEPPSWGRLQLWVSVAEFRATALNSCYRSGATPTTSPNLLSKSEEDRL